MCAAGIQEARRGRKPVTTRAAKVPDKRPDLVIRHFVLMLLTVCGVQISPM